MLSSTLPAAATASGFVSVAVAEVVAFSAPILSAGAGFGSGFGGGGGAATGLAGFAPSTTATSTGRAAVALASGSPADFGTNVFLPVGPPGPLGAATGAREPAPMAAPAATFCFTFA